MKKYFQPQFSIELHETATCITYQTRYSRISLYEYKFHPSCIHLYILVTVPPEQLTILDGWGRILNGTAGPYQEGDNLALTCRVTGGTYIYIYTHQYMDYSRIQACRQISWISFRRKYTNTLCATHYSFQTRAHAKSLVSSRGMHDKQQQ